MIAQANPGRPAVVVFVLCALTASLVPFVPATRTVQAERSRLPAPYDSMKELPLSDRDKRFTEDFPGVVCRLTGGHLEYILRRVDQPTRKLHPAEHCFRGSGYQVNPAPVERHGARFRSCFTAVSGAERLKVCQQIFDDHGGSWSDVSAWYWQAEFGRSKGPWWAVTEVARE